jgi:hypothetical protein
MITINATGEHGINHTCSNTDNNSFAKLTTKPVNRSGEVEKSSPNIHSWCSKC